MHIISKENAATLNCARKALQRTNVSPATRCDARSQAEDCVEDC